VACTFDGNSEYGGKVVTTCAEYCEYPRKLVATLGLNSEFGSAGGDHLDRLLGVPPRGGAHLQAELRVGGSSWSPPSRGTPSSGLQVAGTLRVNSEFGAQVARRLAGGVGVIRVGA
jgi:hypothetical protein